MVLNIINQIEQHNSSSTKIAYSKWRIFCILYKILFMFRLLVSFISLKYHIFSTYFQYDLLVSFGIQLNLIEIETHLCLIPLFCYLTYLDYVVHIKPDRYIWALVHDFFVVNPRHFFALNPNFAFSRIS